MTHAAPDPAVPPRGSLRRAQLRTVALLFLGYAACYYCRADLSVATPLIATELAGQGLTHAEALVRIGALSSAGVLAYALGKLLLTGLGDYWGGRRNFLIAIGGASAFTLLFAAGSTVPLYTLAWLGNRLTQSIGWAGLIKVSSRWFDYSTHGTIAGILSVSYLVGDALARQQMGTLLGLGYGWRALFVFAAAVTGAMLIANALWLRESRTDEGHPEATPHPFNLFAGAAATAVGPAALLRTLLRSRDFLVVCLLSFACTIIRETFNTWTPVYLRDHLGFSMSRSAAMSAVFPGVGAVSVLGAGWLSDRIGLHGRSLLLFAGLAATAVALLVLLPVRAGAVNPAVPLAAIATVALCMLGPYSYLGGAFALDFGGRRASAAASGIIDGIGYLGGVLAGAGVARLAVAAGWDGVFAALAAVSALAALCAGGLYLHARRRAAPTAHG